MENVLNRFKYVRAELEADLEELEEKLEKPEQEKLEFDFMGFWRARQNFDFEGIENLLDLHRKITDAAREALNLEADELEDTQSKLEDIQSDFEIDDVLEYHEDEHHTLEGDELNQIHEALDRTYFNKTGSSGIENEIDRFKHERKEFELELGKFENKLKKSKRRPEFEQHEHMKLEYRYKLEETESYIEDFKHKRKRLNSELDSLKSDFKKKAEQIVHQSPPSKCVRGTST